ncbi:MAG: gamma-glutamyl-gamma-aminobutyrate hydrolase family protein [Bacilli bacterium]|nr:gamma-glutamyl-gamma-aminobutyrate hydrolase family protein [Bacilli bacterium]
MKTVGVLTRIDELNNKSIHYIPSDIFYKLKDKANVIIIPFAMQDEFKDIISLVQQCDGIILPGGDDIYSIETELCKYLYENDIPTFGICLGMQTMACAIEGNLGSVGNLNHKSQETYVHDVTLKKDSIIHKIMNKDVINVNSRHKDCVVSTKLNISAYSSEGIIEAIEDPNKKFFIGVQWHPENLKDEYSNKLFNYFISML